MIFEKPLELAPLQQIDSPPIEVCVLYANAEWWVPLLILVCVAFAVYLYLSRALVTFPYERIDSLCTRTELRFYHELVQIVRSDYEIFGKTRIADLLKVKKGTKKRMSWQNRINAKHIDFILCSPEDLKILVAIELDDKSHQRPDRVQRDLFVNQAFQDAQLPILRIKTADVYDHGQIRHAIAQALKPQNKTFVFHIE